jgi:DNA-directed RNA polymerase I subunit RPA49
MKKMEALGMEFGNKKTRKALDDRTINAIGRGLPRLASPGGTIPPPPTDNVAAAVLGSMSATTAQMPTVAEQNAVMEDSKPRPKPNMDAKIPAEVYPISTLIGNEMMAAINVKDWVEATQAKVGVKLRHRYVANRIAAVVAEKDIKKLKVLRFIHVLMKFKDTLNQKSKKEASRLPQRDKLLEAMKESAPLVDAVKQKFCDKKYASGLILSLNLAKY